MSLKYITTLPKDEFSAGWTRCGGNAPIAAVYRISYPTVYPEKVIFTKYAPKLFQAAQDQYIKQLYKVGEEKMKMELAQMHGR